MDLVFLSHDDRSEQEARRQVRSRAAQHSHHSGTRKPKLSKTGQRPRSSRPSYSRRGSSISTATSSVSTASTTEPSPDDDDRTITISSSISSDSANLPPLDRLSTPASDPFDCYPVPAQPWFAEILDYMWPFMRRGWSALGASRAQQAEAMTWVQRLSMSSSPYFLMNLLSATGDLAQRGHKPASYVVWLTGQVVATINQALNDPQTALAAGTILAVGRIALREIMVGDMNAGVTFHRPAYAKMIALAGGLDALDLPPLVRAHIAWGERLMARKTGVRVVEIQPALASEVVFGGEPPDPRHDVKVLDEYLPMRER